MSVASPERDAGHYLARKFRLQVTGRFCVLLHKTVNFNIGKKILFVKQPSKVTDRINRNSFLLTLSTW